MNPQCTTAAQCLKELARVMEQFGIEDALKAVKSPYIRGGKFAYAYPVIPNFEQPMTWQFAIAEVEGKAVFMYDKLFDSHGTEWVITSHARGYLYSDIGNGSMRELHPKLLSWNPPRPKTVMVELTVEDAEYIANTKAISLRTAEACRKALEGMK